jgi:hypothetical protein
MSEVPFQGDEEIKAQWVKAEYHTQQLPDYEGNVLIEALPPIMDSAEAYDRLCNMPLYDEKERLLSSELRYNALYRLQHFFQPIFSISI